VAWTDLDQAAAYIAKDSPYYAAAFVREVRDAARSLREFAERPATAWEPAPDGAVVNRSGEVRLRLHLVEETVVAEVDLADVDPIVEQRDEDEQREQTTG